MLLRSIPLATAGQSLFTAAVALTAAGFLTADFTLSRHFFARLRGLALPGGPADLVVERLLAMLLLTGLSMVAFSAVLTSLSTLYLAADLELLLASPVASRRVFAAKFLEAAALAGYVVCLLLLPALAGFGAAHGAGAGFYAILPLLAVLGILPPAAAGTLVTLCLQRFFPARRLHQALSAVALAGVAAVVAATRLLRPERLLRGMESGGLEDLVRLTEVPGPLAAWMAAAASSLVSAAGGRPAGLAVVLGMLALAGMGSVGALALLASRFYRAGWVRSREGTGEATAPRRALHRSVAAPWLLRRPTAALVRKDRLLFLRDPQRWSQLLLLGTLLMVYWFNAASLEVPSAARGLIGLLNLTLAGFVLAALALRFAYPSTSLEGPPLALLRSSPVEMRRYLGWKFLSLAPVLLILSVALIGLSGYSLELQSRVLAGMLFTAACLAVGMVGLGVGLGAVWPRLGAVNPGEAATTPGALGFLAAALAYLGAVLWLLARPVLRNVLLGVNPDAAFLPSAAWVYPVIAALTLAAGCGPLWIGAWSLRRRDL